MLLVIDCFRGTHKHTHIHKHTHTYTYMQTHMHKHTYTHKRACTNTHTHTDFLSKSNFKKSWLINFLESCIAIFVLINLTFYIILWYFIGFYYFNSCLFFYCACQYPVIPHTKFPAYLAILMPLHSRLRTCVCFVWACVHVHVCVWHIRICDQI